jgi:hypothetical protein
MLVAQQEHCIEESNYIRISCRHFGMEPPPAHDDRLSFLSSDPRRVSEFESLLLLHSRILSVFKYWRW